MMKKLKRIAMAGTSEYVTVRMKKNALSWFGHVECMNWLMTVDEAKEVCRDRSL